MLQYTLLNTERGRSLTLYVCGEFITMDNTHPHFDKVVSTITSTDPELLDEARVKSLAEKGTMESLAEQLAQKSQRVSWDEDQEQILVNGEPINPILNEALVENLETGNTYWIAMVRFLEKLSQNPSYRSQNRLYAWLNNSDLTLLDDGRFIGYKVVGPDLKSWHSGVAWVDKVKVEGHIPNEPGSVVSMPRKMVNDDYNTHCSNGLHVGNRSYMHSFSSNFSDPRVLTVAVDPKKVVTVPTDARDSKLRVCQYEVLRADSLDEIYYYPTNTLVTAQDVVERPEMLQGLV